MVYAFFVDIGGDKFLVTIIFLGDSQLAHHPFDCSSLSKQKCKQKCKQINPELDSYLDEHGEEDHEQRGGLKDLLEGIGVF